MEKSFRPAATALLISAGNLGSDRVMAVKEKELGR